MIGCSVANVKRFTGGKFAQLLTKTLGVNAVWESTASFHAGLEPVNGHEFYTVAWRFTNVDSGILPADANELTLALEADALDYFQNGRFAKPNAFGIRLQRVTNDIIILETSPLPAYVVPALGATTSAAFAVLTTGRLS